MTLQKKKSDSRFTYFRMPFPYTCAYGSDLSHFRDSSKTRRTAAILHAH